jgi:hypothetical protein
VKLILCAAALLLPAAALAAPPPPPAPAQAAFYETFFTTLPNSYPSSNISKVEALLAPDLQVFDDGKLIHGSRKSWLAWLQAKMGKDRVQSISLSREDFFYQPGDRILVREFWSSYTPGVHGHGELDHRLVSYQFAGERLVRVDYGQWVRPVESGLADRLRGRQK